MEQVFPVVLVLAFYGAFIAVFVAQVRAERARRRAEWDVTLRAFAATLDGARVEAGADGLATTVEGVAGGRALRASRVNRTVDARASLRFEVEVKNAVGDLDLRRRGILGETLDFLRGRRVATVTTSGTARADGAALVQQREVRDALRALLNEASRVELRGGWLRVTTLHALPQRPDATGVPDPAWLRTTFERLALLAERLERRHVVVTVGGVEARRFVWTAGGAEARCPYCRDAVDAQGDDAAACPTCATVHHRECLAEAGGCTVFGCAGRGEPQAARVEA